MKPGKAGFEQEIILTPHEFAQALHEYAEKYCTSMPEEISVELPNGKHLLNIVYYENTTYRRKQVSDHRISTMQFTFFTDKNI